MCNRNATATWSGFSHQGYIGILVALKKIKTLHKDDYEKYFLEYEVKEDAAIFCIDKDEKRDYISVHQVKAYYSHGHLINTYKDVLRGSEIIEKDKEGTKIKTGTYRDGDWCDKDNYLHTVMEITNWTTKKIKEIGNPNDVQRYEYTDGKFHCDTTDIPELILKELFGITQVREECPRILKSLLYLLDEKIRSEHKIKRSKDDYKICFSFKELMEIISSNEDFKNENIYHSRKYFYEEYRNKIKKYEGKIGEKHINYIDVEIIKKIYELDNCDFLEFLKLLNMGKSNDYLETPHYNFNVEGLKQVFFKLLVEVEKLTPKYNEKIKIVEYEKFGAAEKYILTSILDDEDDKDEVVVNIINNLNLNSLLWEGQNIINKNLDGLFSDLNPSFFGTKLKDKSFMYFADNRLISVKNGKKELNNE